jgi:hypothetical protein
VPEEETCTELYARYDGEVGGGTANHAFTTGLRMTSRPRSRGNHAALRYC